MLRKHTVNYAAIGGQKFVVLHFAVPLAIGHFKHRAQAVAHRFIRAKHAEVAAFLIVSHNIAHKAAQNQHILSHHAAGHLKLHGVFTKVRQGQIMQHAAVGHRV